MEKYGGRCVLCGESDIDVLTIDHVRDGGMEHREENNLATGQETYRFLRYRPKMSNFQILCFNCNSGTKHKEFIGGG